MIERMNSLLYCEKKDLNYIRKFFIISRIIMLIYFVLESYMSITPVKFLNLDIEHYYDIALNGYNQAYQFAFFPLFPMIFRVCLWICDYQIGAYIFNLGVSYLSTILIYKIAKDIFNYDSDMVKNIITYWLLSPIAFFVTIPYTEGVFLFLTLLSFYLYRKNSNPYILGVVIGLNALSKSWALMFFLVLFGIMVFDFLRKETKFFYIIKTYVVASLIMLLYPIYCFLQTGNLFFFSKVQYLEWNRVPSNLVDILLTDMEWLTKEINENTWSVLMLIPLCLYLYYIVYGFVNILRKNNHFTLSNKLFIAGSLVVCFYVMTSCKIDWDGGLASTSQWRALASLAPMYFFPVSKMHLKISSVIFTIFSLIIIFCFCSNCLLC